MKKSWKITALFLAALTASSLLAGCGGDDGGSAASGGSAAENGGSSASSDEVRTLKVLGSDVSSTWDTRENQASYQALLEMLAEHNLNLDFEVVAAEQYQQVLQTRLSAATQLPDLVNLSIDVSTILNLGERGILLDVKDIINQYSNGNVENFAAEYYPNMWNANTASDGKMYWMPTQQYFTYQGEAFNSNMTQLIRKDWLDNLGLEVPDTLDEFRDALMAFQENDANGNGEQDEKMIYTPSFTYFAPSFGLPAGLVMIDMEDNTAKSPWLMKDQLVEYITYVKSLIDNNLIDTDAFDKSGEVIIQKMQSNTISATCDWALLTTNDVYVQDVGGVYWPVMLGKNEGEIPATIAEDSYSIKARFGVTKNCKDLQAVADLFDMIFTDEYANLCFYGVEGVTYTVGDNGEKNMDPRFKERDFYLEKGTGETLFYGLLPGNALATWETYLVGSMEKRPDLADFSETYCGYDKKFWYMGDAYLAVPSAEETDQLAQISNDIATYSNETLMKLCLGQYDLANIDEYINTLKELGLEDYVAIYQARHDRYMQAE